MQVSFFKIGMMIISIDLLSLVPASLMLTVAQGCRGIRKCSNCYSHFLINLPADWGEIVYAADVCIGL